MYFTVSYFTGIFYAVVRQICVLFIDNKDSVLFCNGIAAVMYTSKNKSVHKRAVKVLCAASPMLTGGGHTLYGPVPLKELFRCNKCILVHKVIHNKSPQYLRQLVHTGARSDHSSRNSILILLKTELTFIRWVLLILHPFVGMSCLEVSI